MQAPRKKLIPIGPTRQNQPPQYQKIISRQRLASTKENTFYKNYDLVHPTALLKYGFRRWELRLETTARSVYEHLIPDPQWKSGFEPMEIGFKVALWEEKNGYRRPHLSRMWPCQPLRPNPLLLITSPHRFASPCKILLQIILVSGTTWGRMGWLLVRPQYGSILFLPILILVKDGTPMLKLLDS